MAYNPKYPSPYNTTADERLLYTSLGPGSTEQEIKDWLTVGVKMFSKGTINTQRFKQGVDAAIKIVGTVKIATALATIYMENSTANNSHDLYTIINNLISSNKNTYIPDYSAYKYDYNSDKTYYIPPQIDYTNSTMGDMDMQGTEYIKASNPSRKYTHMRTMLHKLWDVTNTMPDKRFIPDELFAYDADKMATYIQQNFVSSNIDYAHSKAKAEYSDGSRGRPKGAKNKSKVMQNGNFPDMASTKPDPILDGLPTGNEPEVIEPKLETGVKLDSSLFVQHIELSRKLTDYAPYHWANDNFSKITTWGREVDAKLIELEQRAPTVISLQKLPDLPAMDMGVQHCKFPLLVQVVRSVLRNNTRIIPWVYGPAGTGKTYACEQLEKVFDLPVYLKGKTLGAHEIMGFINTSGYQKTAFRNAYENGGIFVADELDSWSNDASTALLSPVGNTRCEFPDGSIKRHPNFIMVCCANTTGAGATMDYVGRTKQDGAVMNRFVHLHWPLDEALEDSMCANKDWLRYVRHVRAKVINSSLNPKPLITPRASIFGETLLNTGIEWSTVIDMCLKQGLSDAQWRQIA